MSKGSKIGIGCVVVIVVLVVVPGPGDVAVVFVVVVVVPVGADVVVVVAPPQPLIIKLPAKISTQKMNTNFFIDIPPHIIFTFLDKLSSNHAHHPSFIKGLACCWVLRLFRGLASVNPKCVILYPS